MRLKLLRKAKGLLQRDIAEVINCSQAVYSRYENGEREPSNETLKTLADFYGVSVDYILGRDDPPPPPPADAVELQEKEAAMRKEILDLMQQMNDEQYEMALNILKAVAGRK